MEPSIPETHPTRARIMFMDDVNRITHEVWLVNIRSATFNQDYDGSAELTINALEGTLRIPRENEKPPESDKYDDYNWEDLILNGIK